MRKVPLSRTEIASDTPLRLAVAAALAFPDGSMTASGLRREGARGKLIIERITEYTTLANIDRMRELCRVEAKAHACGYDPRRTSRTQELNGRITPWCALDLITERGA